MHLPFTSCLGACALLAALANGASRGDNTVSWRTPKAFADRSPLQVTEHVLALKRSGSQSRSSRVVQQMMGVEDGAAPIASLFGGEEFLVPISFGNQSFEAIMDTGSSNLWVVEKGFTCQEDFSCRFGPKYKRTKEFKPIAHQNFFTEYASTEMLSGIPGYESVTLGGITVKKQEMGLINKAKWFGDGISSSILGLAYPVVTSVFKGLNPAKDEPSERINYTPLFTNMYQKGLVNPLFSIELGRGGKDGTLSLGGIPKKYKDATFASAPIQIVNFTAYGSATDYSFYTVNVDGFTVEPPSSKPQPPTTGDKISRSAGRSGKLQPRQVISANVPAIVDSGTSFNLFSAKVCKQIIDAFEPAGYVQDKTYFVDCNAAHPTVGIIIGGQQFNVDHLSYPTGDGRCYSGFQLGGDAEGPLQLLGDTFLQSVLAVFDVGASEMRFAQR